MEVNFFLIGVTSRHNESGSLGASAHQHILLLDGYRTAVRLAGKRDTVEYGANCDENIDDYVMTLRAGRLTRMAGSWWLKLTF